MKTRLLGVLAILSALTACGGHASSSSARPPLSGTGAVTAKLPTLSTAWSAPATADTVLFRDMDPSRGPSVWTTPDAVVTIAQKQVRSYRLADGKATWTLALPQSVCASSFEVDGGGIGVLGLGTDDHCTTIAAVDTAHGRLLWRVKLDPRLNVYLSSVASSGNAVTATDDCGGFERFATADGHRLSITALDDDAQACLHAAGDGRWTVTSSTRGTLDVYDPRTGAKVRSLPAQGARVNQVVSDDPLVIDGSVGGRDRLINLAGPRPVPFGPMFTGSYPRLGFARPAADAFAVRYGSTSGDDHPLYAFDLAASRQLAITAVDGAEVGVHDGRVVTAVPVPAADTTVIEELDPAKPGSASMLGLLPSGDSVRTPIAVTGDLLLGWTGTGLTAYRLTTGGTPASALEDAEGWQPTDLRPQDVIDACTAVPAAALRRLGFSASQTRPSADCSWLTLTTGTEVDVSVAALAPKPAKDGAAATSGATLACAAVSGATVDTTNHVQRYTAVSGIGTAARTGTSASGHLVELIACDRNVVVQLSVDEIGGTGKSRTTAQLQQAAVTIGRAIGAEVDRRAKLRG